MKYDPMCAACAGECKQPAAAKLVSCPHFKPASHNLDMFDMGGNVQKDITQKAARRKKETAH